MAASSLPPVRDRQGDIREDAHQRVRTSCEQALASVRDLMNETLADELEAEVIAPLLSTTQPMSLALPSHTHALHTLLMSHGCTCRVAHLPCRTPAVYPHTTLSCASYR